MDFSDEEITALKRYMSAEDVSPGGESYCFGVNNHLRRGLRHCELPAALQNHVTILDQVLSRGSLKNDTTVYRGIGSLCEMAGAFNPNDEFRSLGFWSTSVEQTATDSFITGSGPVGGVYKINLNAGFPGVNLGAENTFNSLGCGESEVLLPRGILWRIINFSRICGDDVPRIHQSKYESILNFELVPASNKPFSP